MILGPHARLYCHGQDVGRRGIKQGKKMAWHGMAWHGVQSNDPRPPSRCVATSQAACEVDADPAGAPSKGARHIGNHNHRVRHRRRGQRRKTARHGAARSNNTTRIRRPRATLSRTAPSHLISPTARAIQSEVAHKSLLWRTRTTSTITIIRPVLWKRNPGRCSR